MTECILSEQSEEEEDIIGIVVYMMQRRYLKHNFGILSIS